MQSTAMRDDVTAQLQLMLQAVEDITSRLADFGEGVTVHKLSFEQQRTVIESLPLLTESQLRELDQHDGSCPICLTSYLAIIAESEMAEAMDSPAHPIEELGVTRLSQSWQCGHMFCRRDITKWIHSGNDSCPLCRRLLVDPSTLPTPPPPTTSDSITHLISSPTSDTATSPSPTPRPNLNRNAPTEASNDTQDQDEEETYQNILRQLDSSSSGSRFTLGGIDLLSFFGPGANNRGRNPSRDRDNDMDRDYSAMYS